MVHTTSISSITFCYEKDSPHFAKISLSSGSTQKLTWKGLYRYWRYAKAENVEYFAKSFTSHYCVFCLSVASGQGGIIAIWNTLRKRWEQVCEANYVTCAILFEEIQAIVSFHYIACWGVPGHHQLYAMPLNRTKNSCAEISIPINTKQIKAGLQNIGSNIYKHAYGNCIENPSGPLGIFLLKDKMTIVAHDAGNSFQFSLEEVTRSLKLYEHNKRLK